MSTPPISGNSTPPPSDQSRVPLTPPKRRTLSSPLRPPESAGLQSLTLFPLDENNATQTNTNKVAVQNILSSSKRTHANAFGDSSLPSQGTPAKPTFVARLFPDPNAFGDSSLPSQGTPAKPTFVARLFPDPNAFGDSSLPSQGTPAKPTFVARLFPDPNAFGDSSPSSQRTPAKPTFVARLFPDPNAFGDSSLPSQRTHAQPIPDFGAFTTPAAVKKRGLPAIPPTPCRKPTAQTPIRSAETPSTTTSVSALDKALENISSVTSLLENAAKNHGSFETQMDGKRITVSEVRFLGRGDFFDAYRCKVDGQDFVMKVMNENRDGGKKIGSKKRYLENILERYNKIQTISLLKEHYAEMPNLKGKTKDTFTDGFILAEYVPSPWKETAENLQLVRKMRLESFAVGIPDDFKKDNFGITKDETLKCFDIFEDDAEDEIVTQSTKKDATLTQDRTQLTLFHQAWESAKDAYQDYKDKVKTNF